MLKYLIKRILQAVPLLLLITILCFALIDLAPYDAIDARITDKMTPAEIAQLKKEADSSKPSVQRLLELEKKVQEQEELRHTIASLQQTLTAIPPEIIEEYSKPESERKDTELHEEAL